MKESSMARAMPSAIAGIERMMSDGAILRHEHFGQRIGVAARAFEADHMPDIFYGGGAARHDKGLLDRLAIPVAPQRAVRLGNEAMGGKPGRMAAAAGKRPFT